MNLKVVIEMNKNGWDADVEDRSIRFGDLDSLLKWLSAYLFMAEWDNKWR